MKLAITGSFGFMDIGDEAMLTEDLHFIKDNLRIKDEDIYLFGHNPEYVSDYHSHPQSHCRSSIALAGIQETDLDRRSTFSRLTDLMRKAINRERWVVKEQRAANKEQPAVDEILSMVDAVLVTGGGTINTRDSQARSLVRMHAMIQKFRKFELPIFISGQTIGPLGIYPDHDILAKEIIDAIDVLTVRDHDYSRKCLEHLGVRPAEFLETFDDAYSLPFEAEELPEVTSNFLNDGDIVAVNVTEYTANENEQRIFLARFCRWLIESEWKKILLLSHAPADLVNLQMILDLLPATSHEYIHLPDTRYWTGGQLKKAISLCDVAVGGRYHFIVFAGTSDTPFVGMCGNHYSYIKQDGFARPLGLSDFILTETETWQFEVLCERYQTALNSQLNLRDRFQRPSKSMEMFGDWLGNVDGLQTIKPI